MGIRLRRLRAPTALGLLVAFGLGFLAENALAVSNVMPDSSDYGGVVSNQSVYLLVANGTLDAPTSVVRIYSKTPTATVTISHPDHCGWPNGSPPQTAPDSTMPSSSSDTIFTYYKSASPTTVAIYPSSSDHGRNRVINNTASCENNKWTDTLTNLPSVTIGSTIFYVATLKAVFDPSDSDDLGTNAFKVSVPSGSGYVTTSTDNSAKFALGLRGNQPYNANINYGTLNIYFALPCSAGSANVTLNWFDADQGNDNQGRTIWYRILRRPRGTTQSFQEISGTRNSNVGGDNQPGSETYTLSKDYEYSWQWNDVSNQNGIQFAMPYDPIFTKVSCINWNIGGSTSINMTTAYPGQSVIWTHTVKNNGPDKLTANVGSYAVRSNGWSGTVGSAPPQGNGTVSSGTVRTFSDTRVITQADVGKTLCENMFYTPTAGEPANGATSSTGDQCVTIPYNYTLVPSVDVPTSVVSSGENVTVTPHVINNPRTSDPGTKSKDTEWSLEKIVLKPGTSPQNNQQVATDAPCVHYRAVNTAANTIDCSNVTSGTGQVIGSGQNFSPGGTSLTIDGNYEVGTLICFALSVKPYNDTVSADTWAYSPQQCLKIGKKPQVQFLGGDVRAGRNIITSTTTRTFAGDKKTFGSWNEYGVFSYGSNSLMASGAGYAGGMSGGTSPSNLTFANTPTLGGFTTVRPADLPSIAAAVEAKLVSGPSSIPGSSYALNAAGDGTTTLKRTGNLDLTNSGDVAAGKTIVIRVNGTLKIKNDITYANGPYGAIKDIPQVILIADNIWIDQNVTRVDAWLIVTRSDGSGVLDTCDIGVATTQLTAAICNKQLTINGPVVADKVWFRRTAGAGAANPGEADKPGETFNFNADAYLWGYNQASQGSGRAITVYQTELPPRY